MTLGGKEEWSEKGGREREKKRGERRWKRKKVVTCGPINIFLMIL